MSQVRIGIDYWVGATHAPGVGRYIRELVRALVALPEGPPLALFDVGPGPRALPERALGLDVAEPGRVVRRRASLPRRLCGPAAGRLGLGADRWLGNVPLFHRAFLELPGVSRALEVLPLAELGPAELDRTARLRLERGLQRAAQVIVFSAAAKRELVARFELDPERVSTLPVGCDHWLRDAAPRPLAERAATLRIVVLGALTAERAPLGIAQVCARLFARGHDLELCFLGRPGSQRQTLLQSAASRELGARLQVREPRELELPGLMASADVLCHLNSSEWTPVTLLEGAAAGASLVASQLPAFEEALGSAAAWVPVHAAGSSPDLDALELALELALACARNPQERARRRALAEANTWEQHARLTAALWNRILSP